MMVMLAVVGAACTSATIPTSTTSTMGPAATTTMGVEPVDELPVSVATPGPLAPVVTGAPLTSSGIDADEVAFMTDDALTPTLVSSLRMTASEMLESIDALPPYSIEAAFSLFGDTHAVLMYGEGQRAHIVVGDHPRSVTSAEQPWLDVRYGRRDGFIPIVEVVWLGLPDDASYVVAEYIGIEDYPETENLPQQVIAGSSFFAIPKPDWTQYVTFTALNTAGQTVVSTETLIDGGRCSASGLNPNPMDNPRLPPSVDETRRAMFSEAGACNYAGLADISTEDGSFFGVARGDLRVELRETDRRFPIMRAIREALRFGARTETRDGETVYVFTTTNGVSLVLDSQGRWIHSGR